MWYSEYLQRNCRSEYTTEIAFSALEFKLPLGLFITVSSVDQEYETNKKLLSIVISDMSLWNDSYKYLAF